MEEYQSLIEECQKIIQSDTARISRPINKMFLIVGFHKQSTLDEAVLFFRQNKGCNYFQEVVIASGNTEEELLANVKEYKRLCSITWEEYLKEKIKNG